ncbi:MAG: hypothetical protein PGN13_07140 [Patulibacter minatonensis]
MNTLNVLIAVDVEAALAASSLEDAIYFVDTNGYLGSWQEGTNTLNSVCQDGQLISWSAAPVNAGDAVVIAGFGGDAVSQRICVPAPDPFQGDAVWNARVEAQGSYASLAYTVTLGLGGAQLGASAFLKVV